MDDFAFKEKVWRLIREAQVRDPNTRELMNADETTAAISYALCGAAWGII